MSETEQINMNELIQNLYQARDLSFIEAEQLFSEMLAGNIPSETIAALLIALKVKGEKVNEIAGLVKTIRSKAQPFTKPSGIYADCCGTGGDGLNTFNVSTASAFVAVECGLPMVKHGNRSVSSSSGSADIIESLGIDLTGSMENTKACFDQHQYCFLFAPHYHPLMAHVGPVRKQLATPTIFNLAGPLANPAAPPIQMMGVCREELCRPLAEVLLKLGCERAMVVYGGGLDEVALHSKTTAVIAEEGKIRELTISPSDANLSMQPLESIQLKATDDPLQIFLQVLQGKGTVAMTSMVAINTGTLLWLAGVENSIATATERAHQAIMDGAVDNRLQSVRGFYNV